MCLFCQKYQHLNNDLVLLALEFLLEYTICEQKIVVQRAYDHFAFKPNFVHYGKFINLLHNNTLLQEHIFVDPREKSLCVITKADKFIRTCKRHGSYSETESSSSESSC